MLGVRVLVTNRAATRNLAAHEEDRARRPGEPEATARSRLGIDEASNGEVLEGTLSPGDGRGFPFGTASRGWRPTWSADEQADTQTTFGAKWSTITDEERERLAEFQHRWFEQRFGYGDEDGLARELDGAGG